MVGRVGQPAESVLVATDEAALGGSADRGYGGGLTVKLLTS